MYTLWGLNGANKGGLSLDFIKYKKYSMGTLVYTARDGLIYNYQKQCTLLNHSDDYYVPYCFNKIMYDGIELLAKKERLLGKKLQIIY